MEPLHIAFKQPSSSFRFSTQRDSSSYLVRDHSERASGALPMAVYSHSTRTLLVTCGEYFQNITKSQVKSPIPGSPDQHFPANSNSQSFQGCNSQSSSQPSPRFHHLLTNYPLPLQLSLPAENFFFNSHPIIPPQCIYPSPPSPPSPP